MTFGADPVTLAVIGAGPAGLAAAVQAARSGLPTTLIDAGARVGGQYWRHGPAGVRAEPETDAGTGSQDFAELLAQVRDLAERGILTLLPQHHVWTVAADDHGCTVRAVDRRDRDGPREVVVESTYLVLAVGAYDRQVPFPGWDLPGVLTVGAAQALLKGSGVVVGPRVLVAGTGPFLLPVAAGLAAAGPAGRGGKVVGVYEANHPAAWLAHLPALAREKGRVGEAAGYAAVLARHRVPVHHRSIVLQAHGGDALEAVTVARLNRDGSVRAGGRRRVAVDVLAVGYGFSTQTELPVAAGCEMHVTADGAAAARTDAAQATSNPRVFAAGETTGVGGAQLAVAEGTLAGAAAVRAAGLTPHAGPRSLDDVARRRDRLRHFAAAMHAVYPVPAAWLDNVEPDTVVCRCEEVTVADVDRAVDLGARDLRTVKLLSRTGMGWCQGRVCGYATSCLLARRTGREPDLAAGAERPVATPIPLGLLVPETGHGQLPAGGGG